MAWKLMVAVVIVFATACSESGSGDAPTSSIIPSITPQVEPTSTAPAVVIAAPATATIPTEPPATAVPVSAVATVPMPAAAQPVVTRAPALPRPTGTAEAPSRPPPMTVAMILNLADRSFTPHQIHGNAGDTVALTFTGGTEQHTFTVSSLGIEVTIAARETKQFTFVMPVEGEVPFFCRFHGSATSGMHGLLIFH